MDNALKAIRVGICIVLLAALCACGAQTQQPQDSTPQAGVLEDLNQQIASLQAQIVVLEEELAQAQEGSDFEGEYDSGSVDIGSLLDSVSASDAPLTAFPALVTEAYVSEAGCMLTYDRLDYNPDFTEGSGDPYLLNEEELSEQMDASYACAQFDGRVTGDIGEDFSSYVASAEGGAQFTFYMLGNELICVAEITVP